MTKDDVNFDDLRAAVEKAQYEKNLLIDIGRALGQHKDIGDLLDHLVTRAMDVTNADAGSVYVLVENKETGKKRLRFIEAQNTSRDIEMETDAVEIEISQTSIVGACVIGKETINIPDLYALPAPGADANPWGFVHQKSFDTQYEYQTRSMLTLPIVSARGEVIGVMQLINKKLPTVKTLLSADQFDKDVIPFDESTVDLCRAIANQAGLALENALLYQEMQGMFDGFVRASVSAIESRDPTTSGHSMRVADLTLAMARATERETKGPYGDFALSDDEYKQLEYAALLHDFGKVGVREGVLVKAQKLYHYEREIIESRFQYIRRSLETEVLQSKVKYLLDSTRDETAANLSKIDFDAKDKLEELDTFVELILQANRPSVLEEASSKLLEVIAARKYRDLAGNERPYLTPEEVTSLQIARGSLTLGERQEIESHVSHTIEFLRRIPWGRTYKDVPAIAGAHHEKLDGTGYPNSLKSDEIPAPSKIMTIADIYDALTASDRPYKRAVPLEKALDILREEAGRGKIDPTLLQIFLDAKSYESIDSQAKT